MWTLYQTFNAIEGGLWFVVAALIFWKVDRPQRHQKIGVLLGVFAFALFGITDLLEISREAQIPLWLWMFKIACGVLILAARYTWLGWAKFRWRDREVLFGVACLLAVVSIISLQHYAPPP
ncbi:hypothetical protein [Fuerstiella marisgermanici]|uniref:DUF2339 domain-containing protein n=1 Tax=Fuerstiella marisgermanici TaxID=1891926 RepID=A0A1P8WME0_9PLAN|nr:hypothetical protein [Fuerstiella marisgermanici]APZ95218.1 hypothetical protein Fuma_04874 [Fuerstiella marisgermanici]